jgi:3,4-dihydroxy 2-butanone 4-phosphate synthase / GTP cyclohydrolase II
MIVEILNEDGTMARRPDLELFAKTHQLKIGTIADLIRYRLKNERSVERIYEENVETEYGAFRFAATRITSTRTCTSRSSRAT